MNIAPNPLAADAARRALVENDRLDANHKKSSASRAALDAEELRDLEQSLYYSPTSSAAITDPLPAAPVTPAARRSLMDRLFRRA